VKYTYSFSICKTKPYDLHIDALVNHKHEYKTDQGVTGWDPFAKAKAAPIHRLRTIDEVSVSCFGFDDLAQIGYDGVEFHSREEREHKPRLTIKVRTRMKIDFFLKMQERYNIYPRSWTASISWAALVWRCGLMRACMTEMARRKI
jgi:hypothetical protein